MQQVASAISVVASAAAERGRDVLSSKAFTPAGAPSSAGYYGYKERQGDGSYIPPKIAQNEFDEEDILPFATSPNIETRHHDLLTTPLLSHDQDAHYSDSFSAALAQQLSSNGQQPDEQATDHFYFVENFKRPQGWGAVADLDSFFAVRRWYYRTARFCAGRCSSARLFLRLTKLRFHACALFSVCLCYVAI